jgi:hypothetical protein
LEHVALQRDTRKIYKILIENTHGKNHMGDRDRGGEVILNGSLENLL